ncbi:MAG: hypothetical protein ACYC3X_25470 [Pirellulaceae bacterium]
MSNTQPKIPRCRLGMCTNPALSPVSWCEACCSVARAKWVRDLARAQQAKDLADVTHCQVASELPPLDTSEAFRPGSPHWGSHPSPTAKVVGLENAAQ